MVKSGYSSEISKILQVQNIESENVQNFIKISLLYVSCNCEHSLSKYFFEIFENLLII